MAEVVAPLSEVGEVSIVGGLVRDLAFYGPDERPISDIDLVITGSPSMIEVFAKRLHAERNRFGGYGLKTEAYKVDFWSLSSTWARRQGHVSMRHSKDLIKCTFFDWDAVIYSTKTRKVHAIDGYLDRLQNRVLDLNLVPNPSIKGNLVRALRRIMMWDVRPGPKLRSFIDEALPAHDWSSLIAAERGAFNTHYLSEFLDSDEFIEGVLNNSSFSGVGRDDRRQPSLGFFGDLRQQYSYQDIPRDIRISAAPQRGRSSKPQHVSDFFDE
jgi:hypothetical protein